MLAMSDTREFPNPFPDYDISKSVYDTTSEKLKPEIQETLLENIFQLLEIFEKRIGAEVDWNDYSVYTGTSGIALLYMHLNSIPAIAEKKECIKSALLYIETVLSQMKKKHFSFLCGVSGPAAVAAVLYNRPECGMEAEGQSWAHRLENLEHDVVSGINELPDELLYGRAGYLYSLMYVQNHVGKDDIDDTVIEKVVTSILNSGKHWAKKFKNTMNFPLYYEWHDKAYIGSAHGFAGILYMLLQAKNYINEKDMEKLVKPSVDLVLSLQFPSGNFPSSLGNGTDRLVHWCHGAPGVIHMLLMAYLTFSEEKYLEAAKQCSDIIWAKGLLKKGYGICHGVAGNGYAHLRLFQVTREEKYLYRALKFAEWCFDYGKHGCRTADRPLSLFEGLAGTIYFLADLLNPLQSALPAFQLP